MLIEHVNITVGLLLLRNAYLGNLILGVADGKNEIFNSVRYSYTNADFFDDKTLEPGESYL